MKITNIFISMATAVLLAGCTSDDETISWENDPYAVKVKITAGGLTTKSNPAADLEDPSKADLISQFNNGDKICVNDGEKAVVYTLNEGGNWEPENGQYLKWKASDVSPQSFKVFYPYDGNASYDGLGGIVSDQSTLTALQGADFMSAKIIYAKIPDNRVLELSLYRRMARVVVKINQFNDQFEDDEKVTDIKLFNSGIPYCVNGEGGTGSTYVYLTDSTTENYNGFISLTTSSGVSLKIAKVPELKQGFSYTYNLNIGKDKIELAGVTVDDWSTGEVIPNGGGEMQPIIPFSLEGVSEESVANDLKQITYDCTIKVQGEWANILFSIFRNYLSSAKEPKITLDLSEVTEMGNELPEGAFASDYPTQSKLYDIVLPEYVTKINKKSLKNTNISSIDLTNMIYVGEYAFENCYELANVVWPEIKCTFVENVFSGSKWIGYKDNDEVPFYAAPFVIPSTVKFAYNNGGGNRETPIHGFLYNGWFEQVTIPANFLGDYNYFMADTRIKKLVVEGNVDLPENFLHGSYLDTLDISNCSNFQPNLYLGSYCYALTDEGKIVVYVKTEELKAAYEEAYKNSDANVIFKVKGKE